MKPTTRLGVILVALVAGAWWIGAERLSAPEPFAPVSPSAAVPTQPPATRSLPTAPSHPVSENSAVRAATPVEQVAHAHVSTLVFGEHGPVTLADIPAGHFRHEVMALGDSARARVLTTLGQLRVPVNNVESLHVNAAGQIHFACALTPDAERESSAVPRSAASGIPDSATATPATAAALFDVAVPISSPPVRHSKPGTTRVIYLDFNGHIVAGTSWNSEAGAPASYACTPYDTDGNVGSFSPAEQASIVQIWERVAESFRAFDVDVTTEEPAAFTNQTARVLITKERDANGVANPSSARASGVAYLNGFGNANYATDSNVAFVYQGTMTEGQIAAVASHETGHHMGLSHDGTSTVEYYGGHGSGETSWGPIMGNPTRTLVQWSKGEYANANNFQDDLAIIAGKLTGRPDDHAGTDPTATPLIANGPAVRQRGILEATADRDTFSFSTAGGPISLRISPPPVDLASNRVSLDVAAELRDAAGTLVVRADPSDSTAATVAETLAPGTYFLRVTGAGAGTPLVSPPNGYTAYGSVGLYVISGTVPPPAAPSPAGVVQEPENQTQFPGNSAVFSIVARGNPATTYQWERSPDGGANWTGLADDTDVSGAATATLTLARLALIMNGERYRCVVSNSTGSATSAAALLSVTTPPPPTLPRFGPVPIVGTFGRGIPAGTNQNLTVSLTGGTDPVQFRWQLNGVDLPGAEGPTYFSRNWQPSDGGEYRVVATNPAGSVTSPGYTQYISPEGGWQWRNPLPTGNGLSRVSFLNGRFLIGGLRGTLLTSTDGTNWTVRTLPAANNLFSFNYFNGLYIALGSLGAVFTSPDAVSWTPRSSGTVHRDSGSGLQDMTTGDGRLVAVGLGGLTTTSNDGVNWTPGTAGTSEDLSGVAYAFDRFHAVSLSSGRIYSSADGVNWTSLSTPSAGLRRIAFGNGRLVAVGNSGETYSSTNGTTWTAGAVTTAESYIGINFINGQFIAVGTGGLIRTSPDGLTWTTRSSGGNRSTLQNVAFGNGVFIIPGQTGISGRALLVSNDGTTWRDSISGAGAAGVTLRGTAASPGGIVAVGALGLIVHSPNGTRWTNRSTGTFSTFNDVAFGSDRFIAVGTGGSVTSSPDGLSWSAQPAPANVTLNGVKFQNDLWVIVGSAGRIFTSASGTGWTQRYNGGATVLNKSAFGNGVHVAVGAAGAIVTSTDGENWTAEAPITRENLNDITFAAGRFVVVGAGGTVATSTNGSTWISRDFSNDALTSVSHAFGHFIATGPGSTYYVSPDGITWTGRFSGTNDAMLDTAVFGEELYLVGENSNILAAGAPVIGVPAPQATLAGSSVTLIASPAASALPVSYQWIKDGVALRGATNVTYAIARASAADSGTYRLTATGPQGVIASTPTALEVSPPVAGRIVNLSVRATAGTGPQSLITGFFVGPGAAKTVLIRGIGPGLTALGVSGALADPQLQLFAANSSGAPLATNDNWGGGPLVALSAAVGAFPLDPASRDSALQQTIASGAYTAQVSGAAGASGVALVELYDTDSAATTVVSRLANVSARAPIGTGGNILIAGFSISGNVPRTVLVRGVGPALATFGVTGVLTDPQLEIFRGPDLLHANDNWGSTATPAAVAELAATFARVGAFALPGSASRDAALLVTLAPGSYTAQISGVNGTTGVALVEVYEVP